MGNIEILMSTVGIKNKQEFEEKIRQANISTNLLIVNQIDKKEEIINYKKENYSIYSFCEKGVSKSRNRLLEIANGDICIFADDDIVYNNDYEKIIKDAYRKHKDADGIIFFVENINKKREKNKKIGNKRIEKLDVMKTRIYELSIRKETIEKIIKMGIKFDENFGPGGIFYKGEDTIFINRLLENKFKIYSVNKKIAYINHRNSSWFKGFNSRYLYDQGAIFYKLFPKFYKIIIIQYLIRKYNLYKKNLTIVEGYNIMIEGANACKSILV